MPTKPIESATISFSGDSHAGISPSSFNVEMFFDPKCFAPEDVEPALKEIKEKLIDAYEAITGERGNVMFDYELEELSKREEKMIAEQQAEYEEENPTKVFNSNSMDDFKPSLREVFKNTWEASIRLPVIGDVTVTSGSHGDAQLKLWLVACAVEMMASKKCKQPKDWTDDEWRTVMKAMRKLSEE